MARIFQWFLSVSVYLFVIFPHYTLHAQKKTSQSPAQPPKLIIVVAFDQMRGDYIPQWSKTWSTKGFNRLTREGVYFPNARFGHASNLTAPGHSIHLTGVYPHKTGIVSNDYYDRTAGRELYCVQDTLHKTFGMKSPKEWHSPSNLKAPTLGTYLKKQYPGSKVLGVSQKDRSSILMSGHDADMAYWFEYEAGGYTTSDYYTKHFPDWLKEWNTRNPMQHYTGKVWNTVLTHPSITAIRDSMPYESMPDGQFIFPYQVPDSNNLKQMSSRFLLTPFAVEHYFSFARAAMEQHKMGKDSIPDLLCMSISSTDYIGHQFGPHSRELPELYYHVDSLFGSFLEYVDNTIGKNNYVLAVTSDHGVAPVPEHLLMMSGGKTDAGRIMGLDIIETVEAGLHKTFPDLGITKWVLSLEPPSLFLEPTAIRAVKEKTGKSEVDIQEALRSALQNLKGIGDIVTMEELKTGKKPRTVSQKTFDLIRKDFYPNRTGEVMFYPKKNWILGSATATHGTPHDYDRSTPLIFWRDGLRATVRKEQAEPADIAPTLAKFLHIRMENLDGRDLRIR